MYSFLLVRLVLGGETNWRFVKRDFAYHRSCVIITMATESGFIYNEHKHGKNRAQSRNELLCFRIKIQFDNEKKRVNSQPFLLPIWFVTTTRRWIYSFQVNHGNFLFFGLVRFGLVAPYHEWHSTYLLAVRSFNSTNLNHTAPTKWKYHANAEFQK